jgi:Tfp pilus assembly protein FimT
MTLLTATIGIAIPRLASFFRGRMLDSEARRVLALSRHAQARATSEGVPMHLWVDVRNGRVGIEPDPSYQQPSTSGQDTEIDSAIRLELSYSSENSARMDKSATSSGTGAAKKSSKLPAIIFQPDGTIDPSSPDKLVLRDSDDHTVVVEKSRNRLTYEISGR